MKEVGVELVPCVEGEALGLLAPVFHPGISKSSVPNGSFFPRNLPVRQVAVFQQMGI